MPGCLTLLFDETEPHVTSLLFKQTTHMYQKKNVTPYKNLHGLTNINSLKLKLKILFSKDSL